MVKNHNIMRHPILLLASSVSVLIVFSSLPGGNCGTPEDPLDTVQTKQGKVQGIPLTSRNGRKYYGFLGVRYGRVPERFAVGIPPEPWEGVKATKTLPPACFQYFTFHQEIIGVEDCLQLNVYSPKPKNGENLPVLVWIFPGGFQLGAGSFFEGQYFMDQDVVLITLNYRLGAMGFLNTNDGTVTGNMGLKDQVLALQWVKENIKGFGGHPDLVTAIGLSAGGASVDYLTISPMAKGLLHRAISLSGSSLNPWAFQHHPTALAEKLAENAECSKPEWGWPEKVKCLRGKEASAIMNAQLKLMKLGFDFDMIHMKFCPSVESDRVKGPRFLDDTPYNLLTQGKITNKVPHMAGLVENEGGFYSAGIMNDEKLYTKVDKDWDSMAHELFYYEDLVSPKRMGSVSKSIRDFYLKGRPLKKETGRGLSDIYSDRFFNNGIGKGIHLHAKHQDVYPYIFDYRGDASFIVSLFGVKEPDGATHADDMIYLFNGTCGAPIMERGTKDGTLSEKYVNLMVSFARDGTPASGTWGTDKVWPKQKVGNPIFYYQIDLENTKKVEDPLMERREFWESLPIREHEKVGGLHEEDNDKDEL